MFRLVFTVVTFCFLAPCVTGSCADGYIQSADKKWCFLFVNLQYNWTDSLQYCYGISNVSGNLASIHNSFDNVLITNHIYNSTNGAVLAARLGGYVYSENGHGISWQWNDNSTFDYHNWYFGLGHLNPGNNVAVSTDDGKWYGKSGHDELPFVCEMLS